MANVLIIDQDTHLTSLLSTYLTAQGFKVFTVQRGEDGMAQAVKVKPDVILLDALMPDATGMQMCVRFRENQATQNIPIIMMSALARLPNQQQYAKERGANEFIPKPLKVFELGELVDKYIASQIAKGVCSDSPRPLKEAAASTADIPTAQPKYTIATEIHRQLSGWLGRALTEEEKNNP